MYLGEEPRTTTVGRCGWLLSTDGVLPATPRIRCCLPAGHDGMHISGDLSPVTWAPIGNQQVGRCGDQSPAFTSSVYCCLPAGHAGWHRGDDGSEWNRSADRGHVENLERGIAATVREIDELRAENQRLRAQLATCQCPRQDIA